MWLNYTVGKGGVAAELILVSLEWNDHRFRMKFSRASAIKKGQFKFYLNWAEILPNSTKLSLIYIYGKVK
jgi:hypothetical protein